MHVSDLPQGCAPVLVSPNPSCPAGHNSKLAFMAAGQFWAANEGLGSKYTVKIAKIKRFISASIFTIVQTKNITSATGVNRCAAIIR
jgi:hypothetical protein